MLLRRIIRHVTDQNWTAIGIDFFIVVVGVFIGIQVSNWNDARVEGARAAGYLERLSSDLDADIATYADRLRFWDEVREYGAIGLGFASGDSRGEHPPWEVLLAFFQASQVGEFYANDATYQELKSAGELGLIENTAVRDALSIYYSLAVNPILAERPRYRERIRGLVPMQLQDYIWESCYRSDVNGNQQLLPCASPLSDPHINQILSAIVADESMMRDLRYWMSTMRVAMLLGRDSLTRAEAVSRLIDGITGGTST